MTAPARLNRSVGGIPVLPAEGRAPVMVIVMSVLAVLTLMIGYDVWANQQAGSVPFLVDVTARQQTYAEQYVKDVLLRLRGERADPAGTMAVLRQSADALLDGGPVPGPLAGLNDLVAIPPAQGAALRAKLTAVRSLIMELDAAGTAVLAGPPNDPSIPAHLQALRTLEAQVSTSTADAADELGRESQARFGHIVRIELLLGLLGMTAAAVAGLLLRRHAIRQSAVFRSLVHNSADMIFLTSRDGVIRYASPATERVLGRSATDLVGSWLPSLIDPRRSLDQFDWVGSRLELDGSLPAIVVAFSHSDGSTRDVELDGTVRFHDRAVRGLVINARDITERRRADEHLRATLARTHAIVETAAEGIVTITDRGRIESFNRAAEQIFGFAASEVIGRPAALLFADLSTVPALGEAGIPAAQGGWEGGCHRKDGSVFHAEMAISSVQVGRRVTHTAIIRDTSERDALQQRLAHQALHDQLTGLANRTQLLDRVAHALARADREDAVVALFFLDLDRFKVVNDGLGHSAGDRLLVDTARRLADISRTADTVARLGGDEFVILYESLADIADAVHIARRILEMLDTPFDLDGNEAFVSASVGIAFASHDDTPDDLLRKADVAMYRAKEAGRSRYEIFDEEMQAWADRRLATENALRYAIDRGELKVHFQPTVDLVSGCVSGAEALLRWERGGSLVGPSEFIEIAEDTGLINPIGAWVFEQACLEALRWQQRNSAKGPIDVAVNLSGRQVAQPDIVADLAGIITRTGIDPASIVIEVTESVLLENTEASLSTLERLKRLGVRIAIDDFGTGYSSLSYLRRFPVDLVKIDRSFVEQLGLDEQASTIVAAIIGLAHALGLKVVAEGVETPAQLGALTALDCDFAQGYYFAAPLPADDLAQVFDRRLVSAH